MILNELRRLQIIQFGVGGTGSWLTMYISKFLGNITTRFNSDDLNVTYTIIDPDTVEHRNVLRQNFTNEDVGRAKVTATKRKNMLQFSKIYPAYDSPQTRKRIGDYVDESGDNIRHLNVIFGCVDSNKIRRNIFSYCKNDSDRKTVYIDAGNDVYHGQVITSAFNVEPNPTFNNAHLFENVNLYKVFPKDQSDQNNDNCAFFGDQTQSVNMMSANIQFMCLQQLLVNDTLPPNYYTFNASGYSVFEI